MPISSSSTTRFFQHVQAGDIRSALAPRSKEHGQRCRLARRDQIEKLAARHVAFRK